jgi:hypothetical protein
MTECSAMTAFENSHSIEIRESTFAEKTTNSRAGFKFAVMCKGGQQTEVEIQDLKEGLIEANKEIRNPDPVFAVNGQPEGCR